MKRHMMDCRYLGSRRLSGFGTRTCWNATLSWVAGCSMVGQRSAGWLVSSTHKVFWQPCDRNWHALTRAGRLTPSFLTTRWQRWWKKRSSMRPPKVCSKLPLFTCDMRGLFYSVWRELQRVPYTKRQKKRILTVWKLDDFQNRNDATRMTGWPFKITKKRNNGARWYSSLTLSTACKDMCSFFAWTSSVISCCYAEQMADCSILLPRDARIVLARYCYRMSSVCPSVCLSVRDVDVPWAHRSD